MGTLGALQLSFLLDWCPCPSFCILAAKRTQLTLLQGITFDGTGLRDSPAFLMDN
jgi:hypothetical protein